MVQAQKNDRIERSSSPKLIPHIPLPFEDVMKDVLKVEPPVKKTRKPMKPKGK